jgi:hypothetical protein
MVIGGNSKVKGFSFKGTLAIGLLVFVVGTKRNLFEELAGKGKRLVVVLPTSAFR